MGKLSSLTKDPSFWFCLIVILLACDSALLTDEPSFLFCWLRSAKNLMVILEINTVWKKGVIVLMPNICFHESHISWNHVFIVSMKKDVVLHFSKFSKRILSLLCKSKTPRVKASRNSCLFLHGGQKENFRHYYYLWRRVWSSHWGSVL